jgi:serine/threonine protein kinase/Tfp pilus assembly protein PilF
MEPSARDRAIAEAANGDQEVIAAVRGMLAADEEAQLLDSGIDSFADIVLNADDSLNPGEILGDFEIISELGRGGMGVVYAARDRKLGRVAALKLLPNITALDSSASERLIAEAQAASALDHPNVSTIYQVGETHDGRRFIAMARYEGETLRQRLSRGPLAPREAFRIAREIASGLAAAHSAGLVHRDVKPENIFLTRQGPTKLLDFGIATLAGSAREGPTTRGTVLYMSPEQARQRTAGTASDVWSLGVVLYEMLAGNPPFTGESPREILGQIADPSPVRLPQVIRRLPRTASSAIDRALQKEESSRFRNAPEFLSELERAERLWSRPRTIRIGAAAVAVLAIVAFAMARSRTAANEESRTSTLAVLPVTGDSSDRESVALASALGNEIAARVVGLGRMRLVRASDSAGRIEPKPGLHLLRLELARENSIPAITVSLQQATSRKVLWSARRRLDRGELREISRDLVIATLDAIGKPATERERASIGRSFPSSAAAYEEYLRGNQLLAIRTPATLESAIVSFRNAARLDTTFAAALARQAYAYTVLVDWGWKPTSAFPDDPLGEGLALADRATRLDSTSADAWLVRAYILVQKDPARFSGAIQAFQHAISLDPYNAEAFHQYGQTLMALGRYTEALAAYRRVLDLEPDRAMTLVPMAAITKRLGRKLQALSYLDSAVAAYPQIPYVRATRALLRAQLGDIKGARADAEAGVAIPSTYKVPQLGVMVRVLLLDGDTARAMQLLAEAERSVPHPAAPSPTDVFWLGVAEVAAGRVEKAKDLLRTVKPPGAVAWFMLQADELADFRKIPDVSAQLDAMDPRRVTQ